MVLVKVGISLSTRLFISGHLGAELAYCIFWSSVSSGLERGYTELKEIVSIQRCGGAYSLAVWV